jgi:VWFA-related protein
LISDGEDRASYHNTDALVKLLQRTNVQVFVIGIVTQLDDQKGLIRTSPRAAAETLLKRIAEVSGGRVFFPRNDSEILRASAEIAHDLHTQYLFSYQSTNPDLTENFRKIEIKTISAKGQRSLNVITRPGYFLTPPEPTAKEKKKSKG